MTSGKPVPEDKVMAMVRMYETGYTLHEIANRFGYSYKTVYEKVMSKTKINRYKRAGVRLVSGNSNAGS